MQFLYTIAFPSSRAQWARTLALLFILLTIFVVAQDWTWFFVEGSLALIYTIILCARFASGGLKGAK